MVQEKTETWHILHIDDDEDDLFLVRSMLNEAQGRNVAVEWAATFREGRQKLENSHYDAVLVDYDLGEKTGIDLIRDFSGQGYSAPMILLTGRGSYDVDLEAMHAGATLYLTKSEINPLLLERSVRYAIERKQVEMKLLANSEALRERERQVKEIAGRFQAVLENSLDVAYRRDLQKDRYDYMSPVVEQILGFTPDEMMKLSIEDTLERIHPQDRAAVEAELARAMELGKGRFMYRFLCKDGSYRWIADHVSVTRDGHGRNLYRTGILRDVTEQVRAEQELRAQSAALRASEERFRLASQAVNGVLYDWSIDRSEMYQSEGLERVVGYKPGEEPGGSETWWPRNIHPEDYPHVQVALQAAIAGEKDSFAYEYRIRHRQGHWVHIWDQGYIVRDASGRAMRVVGMCTDISNRVRAEGALRESEARFRDLANNISQLAWMADDTGWIFWYNQRWFEYTGTTLEEMQGWGWQKVHHPDYVQRVTEKIRQSFTSGEDWEDTFPLRSKDGQYRWFLSRAVPIKDEQGRVVRWFGTNTDITEQLRLQEENRQHRDLLERLLQAVPVGIAFLRGPRHVYTLANQKYLEYARGKGELIGHTVAEKWPEIAGTIIPQMDRVFHTGEPFSIDNAPLTIIRDGVPEDAYFSYTFIPILSADGSIEGVMILAVENTAAMQARQTAQSQTARLEAVLQSLPVGVWISDTRGRLVGKNEQADRIWAGDAPLAESIDQYTQYTAWFADSGEQLAPDEYPAARAVVKGEVVEPVELEIERFDGTRGVVLASAAPILDEEGRLAGAVSINVDISERKLAEEALEVERAKLAAAIDHLPVGVGIGDTEGNTLSLNAVGLELHGFASEAEMFSRLDRYMEEFELRSLDGKPMLLEEWPVSRALRGDFVHDLEVRLYNRLNGSERILAYSVAPVMNSLGETVLLVYVMQDMTERRQAEENLRESEARFRLLADAMPQLVWTAGPDGALDYFNQRYQEYQGIAQAPDGTWQWTASIHPDDMQPVMEAWQAAIRTSKVYQKKVRLRMADGSYRWHLARGVPAKDRSGRIFKWYGTTTDIHAMQEAQAGMAEYAAKLKHSNEELENFAFVASHDLQEPLRKIRLFGDSLRRQTEGLLPEGSEEYLSRMQNAAERMQGMIDGLLDLSRVSTRGRAFEPVDLTQLVEEVISDLEVRIAMSGGQVRVTPLPTIEGDAQQLRRLFQNLISNGLKFQKEGVPPQVRVTGKVIDQKGQKPRVVITVQDNGIGFEQEYGDQIFQPFVRLHGRGEYEGSGIGLAICRKIVERHGGSITASSRPGEGSRFTITLPQG